VSFSPAFSIKPWRRTVSLGALIAIGLAAYAFTTPQRVFAVGSPAAATSSTVASGSGQVSGSDTGNSHAWD